ncbi:MAG: Txe/YoeB family addiction module toxin [Clostridia bacterium]|nr:Txe/YoeB family addiction module toxin [Clostridia bacterium]
MKVLWLESAWEEYCDWQKEDKKTLRRINEIIREIQRTPFNGLGKPERLRGNLTGFWSRCIDSRNRIIYMVEKDVVKIVACKGHYK